MNTNHICDLAVNKNLCSPEDFIQNATILQAVVDRLCCVNENIFGGAALTVTTGDNIYLFGIGGCSWTWSGPNGFASSEQNPIVEGVVIDSSGLYTLITTDENGCTHNDYVYVKVVESCCSSLYEVYGSLCANIGDTITLYSNGPVGASYIWSGPNGFASLAQNPTIVATEVNQEGVYTVVVSGTDCDSVTKSVYVKIQCCGGVVVNNDDCCIRPVDPCFGTIYVDQVNNTVEIYDGTVWVPFGDIYPSVNSTPIAYVPAGTGNTLNKNEFVIDPTGHIWYIDNDGNAINLTCRSAEKYISGSCFIFIGEDILLNATGPAGSTFAWSGPDGFAAVSQNINIVGAGSANMGLYQVSITDPSGCVSNLFTYVTVGCNITVTVFPDPKPPTPCTGSFYIGDQSTEVYNGTIWVELSSCCPEVVLTPLPTTPPATGNVSNLSNFVIGSDGFTYYIDFAGNALRLYQPGDVTQGAVFPVAPLQGDIHITVAATFVWDGSSWLEMPDCCPTVNLISIPFIPTSSGNLTNLNEFVTDTNGDIWFIDPLGNAKRLNVKSGTVCATGTSYVQEGNPINLFSDVNVIGSIGYSWTGPGGYTSLQQNPTIAVSVQANQGNYTVTATYPNGDSSIDCVYIQVI